MSAAAFDLTSIGLHTDGLIALRQIALTSRKAPVLSALPGGFATRRKGHGQEVADVREYLAGDDIRHLDRGSTARTGVLHVRQFQEERDRILMLVADFRPSMLWGLSRVLRSVAAAEALAMIGWRAVEEGARVGLLALGTAKPVIVAPRGRARGMLDVIGGMVRAHSQALEIMKGQSPAGQKLDDALRPLHRLTPSGAEIVIASGFDEPGDEFSDEIGKLNRRHAPRLLMITDRQIDRLPAGHYPIRLPDGRRIRLALKNRDKSEASPFHDLAGQQALIIDAGSSVEAIARQVSAFLPAP